MSKKISVRKKSAKKPDAARLEMKAKFIHAVAEYLVKDQAKMSMLLEVGAAEARAWVAVRQTTGLFGYPTVEEAEQVLTKLLA